MNERRGGKRGDVFGKCVHIRFVFVKLCGAYLYNCRMKRFSILTHVFVIALITTACGAKATPTATPIDFQGTMLAAASTGIALTQAAIPTSTPQPTATVTNTPPPTPTFIPLASVEAALTSVPGGSSATEDPCINQVLPASLKGKTIKIRIDNPTKATVMVSVYLQQAQPGDVCGYRSYTLGPQQPLVINDLVEGCYTLWAWNPDPKDYFMVTNGTSCLNSSQSWTFDISPRGIELR